MRNNLKEYMSTADAARALGLSIASVHKIVSTGDLAAVRTKGGHRRIFITSIEEYQNTHGYHRPTGSANMICIMHEGSNLDPMLTQAYDSKIVRMMSHPLDLIGMEKAIDVLFIDANNQWLQTTPAALIDGLRKTYMVFIYNSNKLPIGSHFHEMNPAYLIPKAINYQFISGYLVGRRISKDRIQKR
jgi:excisionase family DNA binding protein